LALLPVIALVPSPYCDPIEATGPHLAAINALKHVLLLLEDEDLLCYVQMAVTALSSGEFEARFAGLCLLNAVIESADSPRVIIDVVAPILPLGEDDAPRVRRAVLQCVVTGLERIVEEPGETDLSEIAGVVLPLVTHLLDEPYVASQAAWLMAWLTKIPEFPETANFLNELVTRGIEFRGQFSESVFEPINFIVEHADAEVVLAFFPAFVALLRDCASAPETFWAIRELSETTTAYLMRFEAALLPCVSDLGTVLLEIAAFPNEFASDALIPLGLLLKTFPEPCEPIAAQILAACHAALAEPADQDACHNAAYSISFFAEVVDVSGVASELFALLVGVFTADAGTIRTRTAVLSAITTIADRNTEVYREHIGILTSYIDLFFIQAEIAQGYDRSDEQLLARAVGSCLLTTMRALDAETAFPIAVMAIKWIIQIVDMDEFQSSLVMTALKVLDHLAQNHRDLVLQIIQEEENIGGFIVQQREDDEFRELAVKVLETLGYEE
jgi:hypothetical protein